MLIFYHCHVIQKIKTFFKNPCIIGFGSVSGFLGRGINNLCWGEKSFGPILKA